MIERQFIAQKIKEFQIQEYVGKVLGKAGYSHTEIKRTPLGDKVIIFTTRPGIVVGKKGENIKKLTQVLKSRFKMENPEIEIGEVKEPMIDEQYVADKIAYSIERFGAKRFKSVGYKVLQEVINAGAIGAEIVLSGRIPSARARSWRFSAGYLKKSGDISENKVHRCIAIVVIKAGVVGIKVSIMTPDIELPDKYLMLDLEKQEKMMKEKLEQGIKTREIKVEEIETPEELKEVTKKALEVIKKTKEENVKVEKSAATKEKPKVEVKKEVKKEKNVEPKKEVKVKTKVKKETKKEPKDGADKKK